MSIRENLEALFTKALDAACQDGSLQLSTIPPCALERPRDESNGDWASTVALRCSKEARKNPRDVAQIILDHLPENSAIESTCIAGPGFINIKLSPSCLHDVIRTVRTQQFSYGKHAVRTSEPRINLEFVSANPTGPLHVGHGRWAVLGDAIARVMTHDGYQVYREFYINDQGVQMDVFGNSVVLRYLELLGEAIEIPEDFMVARMSSTSQKVFLPAMVTRGFTPTRKSAWLHFVSVRTAKCLLQTKKRLRTSTQISTVGLASAVCILPTSRARTQSITRLKPCAAKATSMKKMALRGFAQQHSTTRKIACL